MMNLVVMALALICAVLIEAAWPALALLGQAKLPLVMCLVLYYALNRSLPLMLGAAVLGGLLSDSMSAMPLGGSTLALAAIGLLARTYRDMVFSGRWGTHMVFGALAGLALIMAQYVFLWLTDSGVRVVSLGWVLVKALGTGIYGLFLAPVIFRLMELLDRMVGNLRMEISE